MASLFIAFLFCRFATSNTITAAPELRHPLLPRQSESSTGLGPSCEPWLSFENSCAKADPSFTLLTIFASQAKCLCYSSSTWMPDAYDSALATCLSYLSTASTSYYTSIDGPNLPRTPCLEVSALAGPGAPSVSSSVDLNYNACLSWQAISSTCEAMTPGFATLPVSAEDNCLCYTSGTFAPSIFDGYWASCLTYYSTASPSFYTSKLGGDTGVKSPCAVYQHTNTATMSIATTTNSAMASSGAGVTSTAAPSTSMPLTTTVPTTSATGNEASLSSGGISMVGMLAVGMFAAVFNL